jgi:hypothetical protein
MVRPAKTVIAKPANPATSFILIGGAMATPFTGTIQIMSDKTFIRPASQTKFAEPVIARI